MPGATDPMLLISVLVFICVSLLAYTGAGTLAERGRVRRRYASLTGDGRIEVGGSTGERPWIDIDPASLGVNARAQRELRTDLVRAGYFGASAVAGFALLRLALVVALPVLGVLVLPLLFGHWGVTERIALGAVLLVVGFVLPRAYLSRRHRQLEVKYRATFPDYLDMLVVCINAGLSLEAALDRAARELGEEDRELRMNFDLMAAEMRAGKSTGDALKSLADRLGLREARSFAALLQQTIELGTDVAQALTVFSEEMRDRRMSRAEEKAAALAPKLTLPLGLFIFPVVLIAILAPAVLKIMRVVH